MKPKKKHYNIGDTVNFNDALFIVMYNPECKDVCSKCAWGIFSHGFVGGKAYYQCNAPYDYCPLPNNSYLICTPEGGV